MKFFKRTLLVILLAGTFIVSAAVAEKHNIKLSLDKKDAVYKKGDKVTLNIKCSVKGKPCSGPIKLIVRYASWKEEVRIFDTNPGQFVFNADTARKRFNSSFSRSTRRKNLSSPAKAGEPNHLLSASVSPSNRRSSKPAPPNRKISENSGMMPKPDLPKSR